MEQTLNTSSKLNGTFTIRYANGKLRERYTYKDGELNGQCETWDEDGQLKESTTYVDGIEVIQPND